MAPRGANAGAVAREDWSPMQDEPYSEPSPKLCECGCGDPVTPGKRWRHGHHMRNRKRAPEHVAKIAAALRGKPRSPEHARKIGDALRGRRPPEKAYANLPRGAAHSRWKGGRQIQKGYYLVAAPDHPYATAAGRMFEHRLVMEATLGRYLDPREVVHHINGDKLDNRPENLGLFASQGEHCAFHMRKRDSTSVELLDSTYGHLVRESEDHLRDLLAARDTTTKEETG